MDFHLGPGLEVLSMRDNSIRDASASAFAEAGVFGFMGSGGKGISFNGFRV